MSTPLDPKSPHGLIFTLCSKVTGLKDDAVIPFYAHAVRVLGSNFATPVESDEFEVAEKIQKKLVRQHREQDAAIFSQYHRKLQSQGLIKNRWAILYLLHNLSDGIKPKDTKSAAFIRSIAQHPTSTPFAGRAPLATPSDGATSLLQQTGSTGSSGFSSIHGSIRSDDPTPVPQSFAPSYAPTPYTPALRPQASHSLSSTEASIAKRVSKLYHSHSDVNVPVTLMQKSSQKTKRTGDNTSFEVPETELLREIVYIFQGIEGKLIRAEGNKDSFKVDPSVGVPKALRKTVQKLAECGWLYNKVRKYADSRSTDRAFGLVGQSFCAALHQELTEYYRLMAVLQAQLEQEMDMGMSDDQTGGLTMKRLAVWVCEPQVQLKALAALVDVCQGKKGGGLASAIHSYVQHGDPSIRILVKHTLTLVAKPIFSTITRWIYDGELEDTYHEFFVASDPTVKDDRLWHDKYTIRKSMIPSFLPMDQAKMILLTGKSINFLRQVCQDRTTIRNRDVVKAAETHQVESIFLQDLDGRFENMVSTIYNETSRQLLEVFHTKYKFMDHLKAMRRYLLLGQGDFIRHLMDLLEDDLAKPAGTLFLHNLTGILETAVRATNAQYDDADILKRLDVRFLEVSPGDTGWDVFSLDYHVDGPIRTVFTPECMIMYLRVFNFLWRAKRMEYILSSVWKVQMANAKLFRSLPELGPVQHQCHVIASEMVHFIQQVQYYISFEVLECSWDELLNKVSEAKDLDHIIAAHQEFLDTIINRSLLNNESSPILMELRTIFDLIIQFQGIQNSMYQAAQDELLARKIYDDTVKLNTQKEEWGLRQSDEDEEMERRNVVIKKLISSTGSKLRVLHTSCQNMVQKFLVMLTGHLDASLQFLSFRLDFNEYYKAREPKLRKSLGKVTRRT